MKYRDFLTLHILHHASEEPVTGSFLMRELEKHGYSISPGTIYPLLHSLEGEGLLKSHWEVRDGRRVRVYEITENGREILEEGKKKLKELCLELLGE
ncbi:PadR family transcriptional regulator [Thermococcus thioreducens]|uniref:PadR family transcriptional regulator n=1 Tax=Thermococcus thioreducens TaxID=277988 RepID=A0A0Q2M260_9EURY|nr:PadR family transcriptional regulator [Thermococcus thioreducens]ASJ11748.1 PadR family transcriptional regulator [Thermococcus thioreducens]KQH81962.1 PadR family transcriptional regulator [Thermococcus thioreducens]SEW14569.1 Transcriptional regulator PadR-like family protein [Thermococcus thioreducens]